MDTSDHIFNTEGLRDRMNYLCDLLILAEKSVAERESDDGYLVQFDAIQDAMKKAIKNHETQMFEANERQDSIKKVCRSL